MDITFTPDFTVNHASCKATTGENLAE